MEVISEEIPPVADGGFVSNVASTTTTLVEMVDPSDAFPDAADPAGAVVVTRRESFSMLAPEESTLEIETEGTIAGFSHASAGSLVATIEVPAAEAAATVVETLPPVSPSDAAADASEVTVTLAIPPRVPVSEYVVRVPGECIAEDAAIAPLPAFTAAERARHRSLLAILAATRFVQKTTARIPILNRLNPLGCQCTNHTMPTYYRLENEAAELMMIEGAQRHLASVDADAWAAKYEGPGQCIWPVRDDDTEAATRKIGLAPSPVCSVRLVSSYEEHLNLVRRMIIGARSTIHVMSCYFFANEEPFVRVIRDLLPDAARRGVEVRLLLDALPAQSAVVKAKLWGPLTKYAQGAAQRLEFLEFYGKTLPEAVSSCPEGTFRCAFFKAKDAEAGYAVKSHLKLFNVDERLAIIGGSNMLPTRPTGGNDCDVLVDGEAAVELDAKFREVWLEQTGERLRRGGGGGGVDDPAAAAAAAALARAAAARVEGLTPDAAPDAAPAPAPAPCVDERKHPLEDAMTLQWHEREVRFTPVMSRPGASGEDAVLRAVIGLIDSAEEEFLMCMGFAALHVPLVAALARATRRGVRVRLLLNSHFSADLRPPMGDLVAGARALLMAAPDAEVYLTGPRAAWDVREEELAGTAPAFTPKYAVPASDSVDDAPYEHPFTFIHGKYAVADRRRCSVGSWNAWARSAFHEAEMNIFVDSPELGEQLAEKWGKACRAHAARVKEADALAPGGGPFATRGCMLCAPFGPFCADAVRRAREGTLPLEEKSVAA